MTRIIEVLLCTYTRQNFKAFLASVVNKVLFNFISSVAFALCNFQNGWMVIKVNCILKVFQFSMCITFVKECIN